MRSSFAVTGVATFAGREGWRWLVEPRACRVEADRLTWTCAGKTDLWRITEGVEPKHDAPAFVVPVHGDLRFEAKFDATFGDLYDQVGILAQATETRWLKVGVELDGRPWLSAVHTHDESDWSRQPFGALPVELAVERRDGSVFCSLREEGAWRVFRVLYLPGRIEVGPYSCAPKGGGFEAAMRSPVLTEM
jgi:regulation of enolase protein 1 (concanavalin A-like superfamily)